MRAMIGVLGAAAVAYGGWLLWPQLPDTAAWLLAGPLVHDGLIAPLAVVGGLVLARMLPNPAIRARIGAAALASTALLLIATPLILRPKAAPPNPGLQDRDYLPGLAVWLAAIWALAIAWGPLTAARRWLAGNRHRPAPAPDTRR